MRTIYFRFLLWFCLPLGAFAQGNAPATGLVISRSIYRDSSLLAQQSIALLPGFSVSTPGFSATLGKPYAVAGQWQGTFNWPFVAIHNHLLPTGKVLAWQGHNDGDVANPMPMGNHVFEWDPATAVFRAPTIYSNKKYFLQRPYVTG